MKIVIHPKYEYLRAEIGNIPNGISETAEIIRNDRNTIYKMDMDGQAFVIKRYKRPTFGNRIAYGSIRKSKARRSYEYAGRLLQMGVDTAPPVAYIEIYKSGLFYVGYFISQFLNYPAFTIENITSCPDSQKALSDFAVFTAGLHSRGIIHGDYNNAGNVLFREEKGEYKFALIDNNRLRFRRASKKRCIREFQRIKLPIPALAFVAARYAEARKWNPEVFCGRVFVKRGMDIQKRLKNGLKMLVGRPVTSRKADNDFSCYPDAAPLEKK